jgi:hypothetical protein
VAAADGKPGGGAKARGAGGGTEPQRVTGKRKAAGEGSPG